MKISILTLFPDMFGYLKESIIGRAEKSNLVEFEIINIRDFSKDSHKKCDDTPFGGGAGMVMMPQPLADAIKSVLTKESYVIYLSPKGTVFNQKQSIHLSEYKHLVFICGRYEGIDQRIIDKYVDEEISIGDYILTGGELACMVVIDSLLRNVEGVLNNDSLKEESFSNQLLEYPQYTRPAEFEGMKVPEVLLNGNHQEIERWRKQQSLTLTKQKRPDLLNGDSDGI